MKAEALDAGSGTKGVADARMRGLLRVPDRPAPGAEDRVYRMFSTSMLLSAGRCLLTYVLVPVVAPIVGAVTSVGAVVGIPLGLLALFFDVRGLRNFWVVRHRWRWPITALYGCVMVLVVVLVARDIAHLA